MYKRPWGLWRGSKLCLREFSKVFTWGIEFEKTGERVEHYTGRGNWVFKGTEMWRSLTCPRGWWTVWDDRTTACPLGKGDRDTKEREGEGLKCDTENLGIWGRPLSLSGGGVTLLEAFFSIPVTYGRWLSRWGGCYIANGVICASTSGWSQEHRVHTRQFNKETWTWGTSYKGVPFSSVQSYLSLCNPMDCSTPGLPVHHQLPKFTQTQVHWVSDAIQPSHPLSSPSLTFNLFQHHGLFKWMSYSHQVAKLLEFQLQHQSFQWTVRSDFL